MEDNQNLNHSADTPEPGKLSAPEGAAVGAKPRFWKISHGSDVISEEEARAFDQRRVVVVHKETAAKGRSKVSQGEDFMYSVRKGDFFYLCRGNSIRLLGQMDSDEARENPEKKDGWYERSYRLIATSKDTGAYTGKQKWWTPNENSTCIAVPAGEMQQFEDNILKPYFHLTRDELLKRPEPYTPEDFLREVYMTEDDYRRLRGVLLEKLNIILQGAPGVGKTFAAKRLAYSIMGEKDDSRIDFTGST